MLVYVEQFLADPRIPGLDWVSSAEYLQLKYSLCRTTNNKAKKVHAKNAKFLRNPIEATEKFDQIPASQDPFFGPVSKNLFFNYLFTFLKVSL